MGKINFRIKLSGTSQSARDVFMGRWRRFQDKLK